MFRRICGTCSHWLIARKTPTLLQWGCMAKEEIKTLPGYQWIVYHPDLLGGQPAVKNMRISVAQVLECLALGMTAKDLAEDYPGFPAEAVPEILRYAAEQSSQPLKRNVASGH